MVSLSSWSCFVVDREAATDVEEEVNEEEEEAESKAAEDEAKAEEAGEAEDEDEDKDEDEDEAEAEEAEEATEAEARVAERVVDGTLFWDIFLLDEFAFVVFARSFLERVDLGLA